MKKFKHIQMKALFTVIGLLFLVACGPKNETMVSITTEASAMGPFFAGPNSLIAEYEVSISSIDGLENVSLEDIKEIRINAIKVTLNEADSLNFDAFTSASLQMVGSTTDMQSIAIKNPITSKNRELELEVSKEADIVDYFKNEQLSLVLDLDFLEDSYAEELTAVIELELTIKHN